MNAAAPRWFYPLLSACALILTYSGWRTAHADDWTVVEHLTRRLELGPVLLNRRTGITCEVFSMPDPQGYTWVCNAPPAEGARWMGK